MELITQFLATVCSTIFGSFFMFYLIALAFDVMTSNKSQSMSRGVVSFSLKIIGFLGKGLVVLSIPVLRNVGEKVWYVASYYADKNKQKTYSPAHTIPQNHNQDLQMPEMLDGASPDPASTDDEVEVEFDAKKAAPPKKKSDNPYENPADPEFIE